MGSKSFIRFTSPEINESQYKLFASTFSQFGTTKKLYLDYNEKYGKIYFPSKVEAQKAYNCLKNSNNLSMILDPPQEEFGKNKMYGNMDIQVEESMLYDLYGNPIESLSAEDGETYVPLNSLKLSGYKLFPENITKKFRKANQIDMENLESFLNLNIQTYLCLHKISLDYVDVPRLIEKCTSVFTKRPELPNSNPVIQRTVSNPRSVESPKSKPLQRTIYNSINSNGYNNERQTKTYETMGNKESHDIEQKNESKPYTQTSYGINNDLQTNELDNNNKEERKSQGHSPQSKVPNSGNSLQNNKINKSVEINNTSDELQNNGTKVDANKFSKDNASMELSKNKPAIVSEQTPSTSSLNDNPRRPQQNAPISSVIDVPSRPVNIQQTNSNRKSIADMIKHRGYFLLRSIINKNLLMVSTMPAEDECIKDMELLEHIEVSYDPQYKPSIGTTVVIECEVDDDRKMVRAVIVSINDNEYSCAVIDYGVMEKTRKIYRLPDEFKDILEFAMKCKTEDDLTSKVELGAMYEYTCSDNKIKLTINEQNYNAVGIRWIPQRIIVSTPPLDELEKGDIAMIVSEHNGDLGIRTRTGNSLLKTLSAQLSDYGEALQALDTKPEYNQLVLVQTPTGIQRAAVKEIKSNNVSVFLIDTGTYSTVNIRELYYIDTFAETRGTLHIYKLKNYEKELFSPIMKEYLISLFKKTKFSVVSHGNGVIDLSDNKQTLSEKLASLDLPVYKTLKDLPVPTVPIGKTVKLFLVGDDQIEKSILAFYINPESVTDIQEQLEAFDNKTIPLNLHVNELCVAKFEEAWYRASVVEIDNVNNEYLVYYIDFGNSSKVSGDNVRELTDDLTKTEPLVVLCRFQDILEKYKSPLPKNIINKIQAVMPVYQHYEIRILSKDGNIYNAKNSILTDNL